MAATLSPPAPKILPFPDTQPGWEQGSGWESRVVTAQTIPFAFTTMFPTPEAPIGAALPQRSPTGWEAAEIHTHRATAARTRSGEAQPKAAAQLLVSIRANERERICSLPTVGLFGNVLIKYFS